MTTPSLDPDVALGSLRPNADGAYAIGDVDITIPVRVRNAQMASLTFLVPANAAQAIIAGTGLAVSRRRQNAMISLAVVRYLDGDLQCYDELGLAFVVDQPAGAPPLGRGSVATYIHRLPVSEEFTTMAGRGIWGFPKWVADLRLAIRERSSAARLVDADGADQLSVTINRGPVPFPSRPMTMACWSNDADGALLRTEWTTRNHSVRLGFGRRAGSVTVTGDGPFAAELRALGFPKHPILSMVAGTMTASFGAPVRIDPS